MALSEWAPADALKQVDGDVYRFVCAHVVNAGSTTEKLQAMVLMEKARRQEKALADEARKVAKKQAANAARDAAAVAAAAAGASALRSALKASTYKLPELEKLLQELDTKAACAGGVGGGAGGGAGGKRGAQAKADKALSKASGGGSSGRAAGAATDASKDASGESGSTFAAETPIFVHFLPPPLRAEGKKDLAWIVHTCDGSGCREAKHVSFHSMTGFSTYEGVPPEVAEGLACSCTIANHHLRGYGAVRWEGEFHAGVGGPSCAVVEDTEGEVAAVDGRAYMQKAKKLQAQVKALEKALEQARHRGRDREGASHSLAGSVSLHAAPNCSESDVSC